MNYSVDDILNVHYALWAYDSTVELHGETVKIHISEDEFSNYVLLPNPAGVNFYWQTHPVNLNDETTRQMKKHFNAGNIMKVTLIKTIPDFITVGFIETIQRFVEASDHAYALPQSILIKKFIAGQEHTVYTNHTNLKDEDIYG